MKRSNKEGENPLSTAGPCTSTNRGRRLGWSFCLLLLVAGVCACGSGLLRKEIVFTQADLQSKVEKSFPVKKKKKLVKVELSNPDILLAAGSERIGMRLDIAAGLPGMGTVTGSAEADGDLVYRSEEGKIAITNSKLRQLDIGEIPSAYRKTVEAVAASLTRMYLSDVTIYTLNQDEFKESLAKLILRTIAIEDGRVVVEIGL